MLCKADSCSFSRGLGLIGHRSRMADLFIASGTLQLRMAYGETALEMNHLCEAMEIGSISECLDITGPLTAV